MATQSKNTFLPSLYTASEFLDKYIQKRKQKIKEDNFKSFSNEYASKIQGAADMKSLGRIMNEGIAKAAELEIPEAVNTLNQLSSIKQGEIKDVEEKTKAIQGINTATALYGSTKISFDGKERTLKDVIDDLTYNNIDPRIIANSIPSILQHKGLKPQDIYDLKTNRYTKSFVDDQGNIIKSEEYKVTDKGYLDKSDTDEIDNIPLPNTVVSARNKIYEDEISAKKRLNEMYVSSKLAIDKLEERENLAIERQLYIHDDYPEDVLHFRVNPDGSQTLINSKNEEVPKLNRSKLKKISSRSSGGTTSYSSLVKMKEKEIKEQYAKALEPLIQRLPNKDDEDEQTPLRTKLYEDINTKTIVNTPYDTYLSSVGTILQTLRNKGISDNDINTHLKKVRGLRNKYEKFMKSTSNISSEYIVDDDQTYNSVEEYAKSKGIDLGMISEESKKKLIEEFNRVKKNG